MDILVPFQSIFSKRKKKLLRAYFWGALIFEGGAYFWGDAYYRSLISSLQQMRLLLGGAYYGGGGGGGGGALIIGSLRYSLDIDFWGYSTDTARVWDILRYSTDIDISFR